MQGLIWTKLFATLMVFLKDFFLKVDFLKSLITQKNTKFGPRSGPAKHPARSGPKPINLPMVLLKEFLEKVVLEKKCRRQKSMQNYPACKELNNIYYINNLLR